MLNNKDYQFWSDTTLWELRAKLNKLKRKKAELFLKDKLKFFEEDTYQKVLKEYNYRVKLKIERTDINFDELFK